MKKIFFILTLFLILPFSVNAAQTFDKATFAAAFDESIDLDKIGKIVIEMEVVPFDTKETPFKYSVILKKEESFKSEVSNRLTSGKINVLFVLVGDDYAGTKYTTKVASAVNEDNTAFVQLVVNNRNFQTSNTADKTVLEDIMKDHFLDEETKEMLDYVPKSTTTTTTTTTTESTTLDSGTIVIGQDKTTTTQTSQIEGETPTKKDEEEKTEEEKQKQLEKEDLLFKILISIILGVLVIGGLIVGTNIYKASKLT